MPKNEREQLWSPKMRLWANDAYKYGKPLSFMETGWGGGTPYLLRATDNSGYRVIDGPIGGAGLNRRVDRAL